MPACDADGSDTPRLLHVLRPLPAQVLLAHVLPAHALNAELAPSLSLVPPPVQRFSPNLAGGRDKEGWPFHVLAEDAEGGGLLALDSGWSWAVRCR